MHTLFLVNPGSGPKNNPDHITAVIKKVYLDASESCEVKVIDFKTLPEDIAAAQKRGITHVFAVGGDGTVNAVASHLIGTSMALGIIPRGSGNGFARHLGYSTRLSLALKQSLYARPVTIDTATWNNRSFVNLAGVGLDAEVSQAFAAAGKRGFLPYAAASASRLLNFHAQPYTVIADGITYQFPALIGIVVANGTQWGYDAWVSADSRLTDGVLDIILVRPFSLMQILPVVGSLFMGGFDKWSFVEKLHAKTIQIIRAAEGPVHLDGEPGIGGAHIQVEVVSHSLQVLLPNTLRQERRKQL